MTVFADRSEMLDIVKGIGILLVFLGHSFFWGTWEFKVIFSFHMPLFFFLSGGVYKCNSETAFLPLVKRIVKSLLLPFVVFNVVALISLPLRDVPNGWIGALKILASVCLGHSFLNGPSWFLISLSSCMIASWLLMKLKWPMWVKIMMVWLFAWIGSNVVCYVPCFAYRYADPFQIMTLPAALLYFWCGICSREMLITLDKTPKKILPTILITSFAAPILGLAAFRLPGVTLDYGKIGHPFFSPCIALMEIGVVLLVSKMPTGIFRKAMLHIGRNSLLYFLRGFYVGPYLVWAFSSVWACRFPMYNCNMGGGGAFLFACCNILCVSVILVVVKPLYGQFQKLFSKMIGA